MGISLAEPHPVVMTVPPEMLMKELRVATTAATADLTPTEGKRIRVLAFGISSTVLSNLTSTLRATLAFGEDHTSEADRIIYSVRHVIVYNTSEIVLSNINVLGEVDEVVRLTNVTFSAGSCIMRAVVYYREE